MANAKPGDRVTIKDNAPVGFRGNTYEVIDKLLPDSDESCLWVSVGGEPTWFRHDEYDIVGSGSKNVDCPECKGVGSIQLFTSTVPCSLCI